MRASWVAAEMSPRLKPENRVSRWEVEVLSLAVRSKRSGSAAIFFLGVDFLPLSNSRKGLKAQDFVEAWIHFRGVDPGTFAGI